MFSPDTTVADLAARHPETIAVFQRFGIEWQGGSRPLAQVCRDRQMPYASLALALAVALPSKADRIDWDTCPLPDLTAHIVVAFHAPSRAQLLRLEQMALRLQGHGDSHRRALIIVLQELSRLRAEFDAHMSAEERELFPLVERLPRGDVAEDECVRLEHLRLTIESQHVDAIQTIRIFRQITRGYRSPDETGPLPELYRGLEEFERLTHQHVQIEKEILFPRAAALAGACSDRPQDPDRDVLENLTEENPGLPRSGRGTQIGAGDLVPESASGELRR